MTRVAAARVVGVAAAAELTYRRSHLNPRQLDGSPDRSGGRHLFDVLAIVAESERAVGRHAERRQCSLRFGLREDAGVIAFGLRLSP
jgi:hypothetical protein